MPDWSVVEAKDVDGNSYLVPGQKRKVCWNGKKYQVEILAFAGEKLTFILLCNIFHNDSKRYPAGLACMGNFFYVCASCITIAMHTHVLQIKWYCI